MNISIQETMKTFVDEQVQCGGYGSASEDIRDLVRREQKCTGRRRNSNNICLQALMADQLTPVPTPGVIALLITSRSLSRSRGNLSG